MKMTRFGGAFTPGALAARAFNDCNRQRKGHSKFQKLSSAVLLHFSFPFVE